MADDKDKDKNSPPATEQVAPAAPKRYRNRTSLTQTVYLTNGESVRVLAGDTVVLPEAVALKHFNLFSAVLDK